MLQIEPRIAPLERSEAADSIQQSVAKLMGATGRASADVPIGALPEIMFTMCRVPGLWNSLIGVTVELQGASGVLPTRDRKLAILRTTWLCQAPYVFGEHVKQAKRLGFTSEEIERVITGSSAPEWEPGEGAILSACDELHDNAMVSDVTWQQLAGRFDEAQLTSCSSSSASSRRRPISRTACGCG